MSRILSFILIACMLQSCSDEYRRTFGYSPRNIKYLKDSLNYFDGDYSNSGLTIDTVENLRSTNLWESFFVNKNLDAFKFKVAGDSSCTVRLHAISNKQLEAILLRNNEVIQRIILTGRIDGNYFIPKVKYFIRGIPLLLFFYRDLKLKMSITDDENLVIECRRTYAAPLFIIPFGQIVKIISPFKSENAAP